MLFKPSNSYFCHPFLNIKTCSRSRAGYWPFALLITKIPPHWTQVAWLVFQAWRVVLPKDGHNTAPIPQALLERGPSPHGCELVGGSQPTESSRSEAEDIPRLDHRRDHTRWGGFWFENRSTRTGALATHPAPRPTVTMEAAALYRSPSSPCGNHRGPDLVKGQTCPRSPGLPHTTAFGV